jgi:hypothetical protein
MPGSTWNGRSQPAGDPDRPALVARPRVYLRDPEGFHQMLRPACHRCTARYGIPEPVACHLPPHRRAWRRHRLWIGPAARTRANQLDISQLPEILRAAPPPRPAVLPPVAASGHRRHRRHPQHPLGPPRRGLDPAPAAAPPSVQRRYLASGRTRRHPRPAMPRSRPPGHRDRDLPRRHPARHTQLPGA